MRSIRSRGVLGVAAAGFVLCSVANARAEAPVGGVSLAEGLASFRHLQPHLTGPSLGRAASFVRRGQWRAALRELTRSLERGEVSDSKRGPAQFVAGLCARRIGDSKGAAKYFAAASQSYPMMRDEALYYLGDALRRLGEHERAAQILVEVAPSSPRFEAARSLWARSLERLVSAPELAETLLRFVAAHPLDREGVPPLPAVAPPPRRQTGPVPTRASSNGPAPSLLARRADLSFLLARALDRSGRVRESLPHYLYTWARFPGTAAGSRAGDRLQELRRSMGKAARPDAHYRFVRGRALIAGANPRAARRVLAPLLAEVSRRGSAELRWSIELALAVALARSGEVNAASARFDRILKGAQDPELRGEAAYRAAEVAMRRRQVDRAIRFYGEAGERGAGSRAAPLALSDGGEIAKLYGRRRDAERLLKRLVREYPRHERVARARWRLGWYAFRSNEFESARQHFEGAVRAASGGDEEMRALYWLARVETLLQRPAHAAAAYRTLVRVYPLSYYGYLARARLADVGAHDSSTEEMALAPWVGRRGIHARSEFEDGRLVRARELVRLSLQAEAQRELKAYEHGADRTEGGLMVVASLYQEMGLTRRAHWTLRSRAHAYRRHPGSRALAAFWRQAYPRRYVKEIQQAASRAEIPAPLLFALVREESTFEPRAVSPQRAVGLTQVIWETATDMARLLRIKLRGRKDLFQPRINALLGGRFLANLLKLYRGRSLLAVAAYNAGPGNVDRWLANRGLRRHGPVPEDEIVEDIPFQETRLYVRKVFGSFAAYAHLYYGDRIASAAATWDGALAALLP
jgi:soluble lytic murein transglycosylase